MTAWPAETPNGPTPHVIELGQQVTPDDLARYAVALANTQGGQLRVLEAAQTLHPLEVTHAIFALSGGRLTVNVWPEGSVLCVQVPQAAYVLSAPDGSVSGWDGRNFVPVSPAASLSAQQDYTATVPATSSLADLDPVEVARLRSMAHKGELSQLADLDFLRELGLIVESRTAAGLQLRPTIAGILLAGTERALRSHIPQAEVCYYHHISGDVEFQFREDQLRPLVAILTRLSELIQARNSFTPVQVGLFRIEVWDQDEAVYREALLNALTHRDYQLSDVVHVHYYPDRLEIMNPGGLSGGITTENILRHQPKRRNPLLAEVLARLGLVERAGVGVDKMYALMLRYGKEPPEYLTYPDAVSVSLHNPGFDASFVRFVARKQEEMQVMSLDMLIVLSVLGREGEATRASLARALQLPEERTPRLLRMMEEKGLIVSERVGRERVNRLSPEAAQALRGEQALRDTAAVAPQMVAAIKSPEAALQEAAPPEAAPRPTPKVAAKATAQASGKAGRKTQQAARHELEALVVHLAAREQGVSNRDLREAAKLSSHSAWRLLSRLTQQGRLRREGAGVRVRYLLVPLV